MLFRLILKNFVYYILTTLLITVFIFVLFDFILKSTTTFEHLSATTEQIFAYYLFALPKTLYQMIPVAVLISSIVTIILFARSNQIIAMKSLGMSTIQLAMPLLTGGIIMSCLMFFIGEQMIPLSMKRLHHIRYVEMARKSSNFINTDFVWYKSKNKFIQFIKFDKKKQRISPVRIIEVDSHHFKPKKIITANYAEFSKQNWIFYKVYIKTLDKNQALIKTKFFNQHKESLPFKPKTLEKDYRSPDEMSIRRIKDFIVEGQKTGKAVKNYRMAYHFKWAFAFSGCIMSLVGLLFSTMTDRSTEMMRGIIAALLTGACYWILLRTSHSLSLHHNNISAWVSSWGINMWILFVFFIQLRFILKKSG